MEPIVSSETSAIRTQTPGNYPKRNKLHLEHGESLKTRLIWSGLTGTCEDRSDVSLWDTFAHIWLIAIRKTACNCINDDKRLWIEHFPTLHPFQVTWHVFWADVRWNPVCRIWTQNKCRTSFTVSFRTLNVNVIKVIKMHILHVLLMSRFRSNVHWLGAKFRGEMEKVVVLKFCTQRSVLRAFIHMVIAYVGSSLTV